MNENWTPEEEENLANYIAEQVIGKASGRLEDYCLFNMPRDRYFVGNLRSGAAENDENVSNLPIDLRNKLCPTAFGAEFLVHPQNGRLKIKVTIQWTCYYRIFPSLVEQLEFQGHFRYRDAQANTKIKVRDSNDTTENGAIEDEEEKETRLNLETERQQAHDESKDKQPSKDTLCLRFQKIQCKAIGDIFLQENTDGIYEINLSDLEHALDTEFKRIQQIVNADKERLRTIDKDLDNQINITSTALSSESEYTRFKDQHVNEIPLSWNWDLEVECNKYDNISNPKQSDNLLISINFINMSPMLDSSLTRENFFFDTSAEFRLIEGEVLPFTLELAPRGFRYDRNLWGRGFNCAVEKLEDTKYRTTHTPHYSQKRYLTQTEPSAPFEELSSKPIPILESILSAMNESLTTWDTEEANYRRSFGNLWDTHFKEEFDRDKNQFQTEIRNFEQGLELIRVNPDIQLAFQLTNEAFSRAGNHPLPSKRKKEWRLFQIVFLVSQIPGITAFGQTNDSYISEREMVDIIYFPTGGGKTEAYLGVLVFHCFFDRLRGKRAGVTAWTRFPLRLLTLQQTQRMADIIGAAELVRCEQSDPRLIDKGIAGFAVGYFVGKEGTPNELLDISKKPKYTPEESLHWSHAVDKEYRQRWKRVVTCPSCRTNSIQVDLDQETVRLRHRCVNGNCAFPNGLLPIYVIDNEIYRYLPSVIVGTIDKLAGLGNQRKFSLIFGQVTGYCTKHGYYKGKCCQKECNDSKRLINKIPTGISGPTLFIQDELHLLREGLGTFDAHYETFTQELLKKFGQTDSLKIIASSATIEAFERQVEHLYGRTKEQSRVFPGPGPTLGSSFYAKTQDYAQRIFYGIIPHNKTLLNSVLELLQYYHETLQTLQQTTGYDSNPYNGSLQPDTPEWNNLIDNYITSLAYFLATRDLSSIHTDLENSVNTELQRKGYRQLEISEMTGSTSTSEVTDILEKVERPCPPPGETPDSILATSMISHGVDVDRFNGMLFYGMPRQNAEYIQASSRIGRQHVGLVLMCLHPGRERDQSHYTYFTKFHEFLGQFIEPVAINRWSKFSVKRTLPGLFMSVLLQYIANSSEEGNPNLYYMLNYVKKQISSGTLTAEDFIPLLEKAYGVTDPKNETERGFCDEIQQHVRHFLDQIIGAGSHELFVSNALIPRPMRSLRDVDEVIEIELEN
ncbi:hypothetical protein JT359_11930 [Candidatus Poribacteria bacterium]|nr:hypothetical protein [Candidatus Poribacteria bacterium]